MKLTAEERRSALWLKLKEHYEKVLSSLRERNDNDQTDANTYRLRGRIHEVKGFLALEVEREQVEEPPTYD